VLNKFIAMKFNLQTKGHYDFIDITMKVEQAVSESNIKNGIVVVFASGSTAAITTMEYEEGVMEDLKNVFEKLAPEDADYKHHLKWGDRNGAAHIKAALVGPDLTIPIENGKLQLGTWQQIILIDFDEKPRNREIIVKLLKC